MPLSDNPDFKCHCKNLPNLDDLLQIINIKDHPNYQFQIDNNTLTLTSTTNRPNYRITYKPNDHNHWTIERQTGTQVIPTYTPVLTAPYNQIANDFQAIKNQYAQ